MTSSGGGRPPPGFGGAGAGGGAGGPPASSSASSSASASASSSIHPSPSLFSSPSSAPSAAAASAPSGEGRPPFTPGVPPGGTGSGFDAEEVVPLENSWCFWHDKFLGPSVSVAEYEASLHNLCSFSTVQEFWKCFNNLPPVEKLRPKSSFHLMKDGISPLWEDPKNANGGFWAMRIRKQDTAYVWKELVLALIGEQFEPVLTKGDDICGLTVSIRQADDIIRLWNTNAELKTSGLLGRLKQIIPQAEIRAPFYKANREHSAFSHDRVEKKKEGKD